MESFMKEFEHLKIQLEDIKKATNSFSDKDIGSGGFGKVYQGELSHYKGRGKVAIKRLDDRFGQGNSEFWKEIMMLSRYTHQNLILLLGFCDEGGEKILVYEHALHGSLDRHLSSTALTWTQRIQICLDTARGLAYLHDHKGTQQRVIHRDIKSPNILLDHNWNAKVADFGLSKIGPANQQHTDVVSNVVGTFGYLDPNYMDTGLLTKESDVYSFGVVLFEVLCGRLCYTFRNGRYDIFVGKWKQCYEEKKLDGIIFKDLMKPMNPSSLEAYSEIAYQCLHRSSKKRPPMAHIVEKLEIALEFQVSQDLERPKEYEDILMATIPPLIYRSLEELNMLLAEGVLLNGGKTWLSLNMKGERCEMISIAQCLIPSTRTKSRYLPSHNSRFEVGCYEPSEPELETHVKTQFLSPLITYTVNLVFKNKESDEQCIGLEYKLKGGKTSYAFLSDEREDGWLTAELFQFTSDGKIVDLKILFDMQYCRTLLIEGIEFQPLEEVEHEVLIDEKVDMQATDTYFKQKPETVYDDGKKYLKLPTRVVLKENGWKSLPEIRFEEVAHHSSRKFGFYCDIKCKILARQTTYAAYLVYKQEGNYRVQPPPAQVKDKKANSEISQIYFSTPQTPVIIKGKVDFNNHKPSCRPKIKGLPKQRSDGWMEVQIWEFHSGTTTGMIPMNLKLSSYDEALEGIEVRGIEFRPM